MGRKKPVNISRDGGIGRRTRLKIVRRNPWEFDSPSRHIATVTIIQMTKKIKLLVILGPTATGKSDLAVELAHWITDEKIAGYTGAEIISADSRQVYKGLDIGTGKITASEMRDIPHYCLDIADVKDRFSVSDWKKSAETAVGEIVARGALPIICGGTGYYIDAIANDLEFLDVENDPILQNELEKKTVEDLFAELMVIDPARANTMNNGSDNKNKRRLVRSIIIARQLGSVPALNSKSVESKYEPIYIGVNVTDEELKLRIKNRLTKRLDAGMVDEAIKLHNSGLSFDRMDELGLEYRYQAKLMQGELKNDEFMEMLNTKIWQFARRQKTWFRKNAQIKWFEPTALADIKDEIVHSF